MRNPRLLERTKLNYRSVVTHECSRNETLVGICRGPCMWHCDTSRSLREKRAVYTRGGRRKTRLRMVSVMVSLQTQFIMKRILLFLSVYNLCNEAEANADPPCVYPGSPQHGTLSLWRTNSPNASIAEFSCDPGYELVGPKSLSCTRGRWDRGIPYCVRDLARGKPVTQNEPFTKDFNADLLVDGDDTTCTGAAGNWSINLFEKKRITTVRLVPGADIPANTTSILIGDEPMIGSNVNQSINVSGGRLCVKINEEMKKHTPYFVKCDSDIEPGSFVSVRVDTKEGPVPLCAFEAHSATGVSREDACPEGYEGTFKDVFNGICFEFHYMDPAPISDARSICYGKADGRLIGSAVDQQTLHYLRWRIEKSFRGSSFWLDLNPTAAEALQNTTDWTIGAGKGDCHVLNAMDGFSRSECQSPNNVICAYNVVSCGRPRLPKAFDGWQLIDKLKSGHTLKNLRCSEGFYPDIENPVACDSLGEISGAFRCRGFPCGVPPAVTGGFSRSTSNHTVEYRCGGGLFVKGNSEVVCDAENLTWSEAPSCMAFFEIVKDWFRTTGNDFMELHLAAKIALFVLAGVVILLILFGIFYHFRSSRRQRGIKGAFRLDSQIDLATALGHREN